MNKFKVSVGIFAFVGLAAINFTQSESNFVNMALASSSNSSMSSSSSSSSTSSSINHAGGLANNKCPIWDIEYSIESGMIPKTTITCKTGGGYKCESGTCPHGV